MTLANFLVKKVSWPLFDLVKGSKIRPYYNLYRKAFKWTKDEIENFQLEKARKLIRHAQEEIPFYKKKFAEYGVSADSLKSLSDLKKFPCLTRSDIQDRLNELTPPGKDLSKIYKGASSGSTGRPISYYIDQNSLSAGRGAMYAGWTMAGWLPGDRGIHIWGNPRLIKTQWSKPSSKLKDIMYNHYKYPAYKLTERKEFDVLIEELKRGNYHFVDGYTTAVYLLAKYIGDNKVPIDKYAYVMTTAETLQDFMRKTINENLGPVYDGYGCSEIEGIANQCKECGNYHVIDPHCIVEFDDENVNMDGSRGIIVTELENYVLPFIRYRIGDLAVPAETNHCSLKFTPMKSISGRLSDVITLPGGGNLVVASFFGAAMLKKLEFKINQYQVVKESPDQIVLKLMVNNTYVPSDEEVINEYLQDYLGDKIKWKVEIVDEIKVSENGKYKLLIDKTRE